MITTHILDTCKGKPAEGVTVRLQRQDGTQWKEISTATTNADGRCTFECDQITGTYQLAFEVEPYLKVNSSDYFLQTVPVIFLIKDTTRKYHVPLLLNPFGYSTYRGS